MSKEDLARFKSADAKRLALQRRKAALDRMAADLDAQQAGIMERAERDFSGQSLGASSGQLAQLAANHVPLERYHAGEPEQRAQWSMSVQPAPHLAHESHVSQPDGGPSRLDRKRAWEGCGGAAAAAPVGAPGGRQRNEKSYRRNELCAFVAKCTNEYANQQWISIPCLQIYCRALNFSFPSVQRVLSINGSRRSCESVSGHKKQKMLTCKSPLK